MKTSEVLFAAADDLEVNGWTTGCGGMRVEGPHCALGAIGHAAGGSVVTPGADIDPDYSYDIIDHPAGQAFARYLTGHQRVMARDVFNWNDEQESTAPVIEALRACAVIESVRESETALAVT